MKEENSLTWDRLTLLCDQLARMHHHHLPKPSLKRLETWMPDVTFDHGRLQIHQYGSVLL